MTKPILSFNDGELTVWSLPYGKFDVVYRKRDGHYRQVMMRDWSETINLITLYLS